MVLVPLLKIQSGEIICHGYLGFLIEPVYNSFLVANSKQHHVFFYLEWTSSEYLFRTAGQEHDQRLVVWFVEC